MFFRQSGSAGVKIKHSESENISEWTNVSQSEMFSESKCFCNPNLLVTDINIPVVFVKNIPDHRRAIPDQKDVLVWHRLT